MNVLIRLGIAAALVWGCVQLWPTIEAHSATAILVASAFVLGALMFAFVDSTAGHATKSVHLVVYGLAGIFAGLARLLLGKDNGVVQGMKDARRDMYLDHQRRYGDEFIYIRTRRGGRLEQELEQVIKTHEQDDATESETVAHNGYDDKPRLQLAKEA